MIIAYSVNVNDRRDLPRLKKLALYLPIEINFTNNNLILDNLTIDITDSISEIDPYVVGIRSDIRTISRATLPDYLEKLIIIGEELEVSNIIFSISEEDIEKVIFNENLKNIFNLLVNYKSILSFDIPLRLCPKIYNVISNFLGGIFKLSFSYTLESELKVNEANKVLNEYFGLVNFIRITDFEHNIKLVLHIVNYLAKRGYDENIVIDVESSGNRLEVPEALKKLKKLEEFIKTIYT